MTCEDNTVLRMCGIDKSFALNRVLKEVDFDLKVGEVHAIMGENGAGKSTLMKILMGIYKADRGQVYLDGEIVNIDGPKRALEYGIAMIHQELNPIRDMEIAENIFVGRELLEEEPKLWKCIDKKRLREKSKDLLDELSLNVSPSAPMRSLSVAQCQLVEIAKAISWDARVIVMDEPTSAITEKEAELLFSHIRKLCKNGVAVIYISHRIEEVFQIADRISVLRDGEKILTSNKSEIDPDTVISMMVGRRITEIFPKVECPIGEVLLEVENLSCEGLVHNISFKLHRGEVLGFAGLVGAGRSELMDTLFGIRKKSNGTTKVNGQLVDITSPRVAVKHKIAFITEDRKLTGLNLGASILNNVTIVSIKELTKRGLLHKGNERKATTKYIDKLRIKAESCTQCTRELSGGNQQKVVLAKWLLGDPDIIIMDEPTRGIDVGAKRDIYLLIGELVKQGKGVVIVSSEMPEVMGVADRIITLAEGNMMGECSRVDGYCQEEIMRWASSFGGEC